MKEKYFIPVTVMMMVMSVAYMVIFATFSFSDDTFQTVNTVMAVVSGAYIVGAVSMPLRKQ